VRLLYSPVIPDKTHAVWTTRSSYRYDSMKRTKDVRNKSAMFRRRLIYRRFKHHTTAVTMKEVTLFLPMPWMCMGGMKVQRQPLLNLARVGGEWSLPGTLRRQPMNRSVGHVSLYWRLAEEKTCPCRVSKDSSDSQPTAYSLYHLSYAGSTKNKILYINFKRSICSQISFLKRKESMHMRPPRCVCVCVSVSVV
jgi:hypothetical protein